MADGSDPSISQTEGLHAQVQSINFNSGVQQQRTPYRNTVWTRQSSVEAIRQPIPPGTQSYEAGSSRKLNFVNSVTKSFYRSDSLQDEDLRKSAAPPVQPETSYFINQGPQVSSVHSAQPQTSYFINQRPQTVLVRPTQPQAYVVEQSVKPYWEGDQYTYTDGSSNQFEGYPDENYGAEPAANQYPEGYSDFQKANKKKGLSVKIDRFVQRFPTLGKLYKQPTPDRYEPQQSAHYGQSFDSIYADQTGRELTADELALHARYSEKASSQSIDLQTKDKTQPVDICAHSPTNKIYLCDIGRCLVEIYDLNGTLLHTIDSPTMIKFQPTAITVTVDGTIIVASYFSHCLHMYAPIDGRLEANSYSYKQFKLGAPGNQLHQFHYPSGITIDKTDGYLYVCDRGNHRIQVFRPEGFCERVIELFLNVKKKQPVEPNRVVALQHSDQLVCIVSPGDVICFIPKQTNGRLQIDPLYIYDEFGIGLEGASGLAVDEHDRIFISDTGHNRVIICTPDGSYIASLGTEGDGLCQLRRPCGLNITNDGTVIVTDPGNKRIQFFGVIREQASSGNNLPKENPNEINTSSMNLEQSSTGNNLLSEAINEHHTSWTSTQQAPTVDHSSKESVHNTDISLLRSETNLREAQVNDSSVLSARSEDDLARGQFKDKNALSTIHEHPTKKDIPEKQDYNKTIDLLFNGEEDLSVTL